MNQSFSEFLECGRCFNAGTRNLIPDSRKLPAARNLVRSPLCHVLTRPGCRAVAFLKKMVGEDEALSTLNAAPTLSSVPAAA